MTLRVERRKLSAESSFGPTRSPRTPSSRLYGAESPQLTSKVIASDWSQAFGNESLGAIRSLLNRWNRPLHPDPNPEATFPPPIQSSATYAMASHSWDAFMRARLAPR